MYVLDFPVMGEPSKFAFAHAVLAKMENRLLSQSQLDQLRVADSMMEFNRMLSETEYGSYLETGESIEDIVEKELIKTREELYEVLPDEVHPFFDIFYRKYDYNNLKMLLKAHFLDRQHPMDDLSRAGSIPVENLLACIEDDDSEEGMHCPFDFKDIEEAMKKSKELRTIDAILDRAYYTELYETAVKLKDRFFIDFVKQQIDLKNIIIFIRCKKTEVPLYDYLLEGGYIEEDVFEKYAAENLDTLTSTPEFYYYRDLLRNGLSALAKTNSYAELETAIRNHMIFVLAQGRDVFFTVKPFIGYLLAKEHELNLLKKFYIYISNHLEFGSERDKSYV